MSHFLMSPRYRPLAKIHVIRQSGKTHEADGEKPSSPDFFATMVSDVPGSFSVVPSGKNFVNKASSTLLFAFTIDKQNQIAVK
jgi:hypothetical protein